MTENDRARPPGMELKEVKTPPIRFRLFKIEPSWRLFWLGLTIIAIFVGGAIIGKSSKPSALIWAVGLLGLFWALVHKNWFDNKQSPAITKGYRRGAQSVRNATGASRYRADPYAGTHVSGQRRRAKASKAFGRIEPIAHLVGGKNVLGILSYRFGTYTVCLSTGMSSLFSLNGEERQTRIRNFVELLNNVAEHGGIYRFGFKIQTLLGEHHDPESEIDYLRRESNLQVPSSRGEDEYIENTKRLGRDFISSRLNFTFTFEKRYLEKEAKLLDGQPEEVIEQELQSLHSLIMGDSESRSGGASPIGATKANWWTYNDFILNNLMLMDPRNGYPVWSAWYNQPEPNQLELLDESEAWPYDMDFRNPRWGRLGDSYIRTYYAHRFARGTMTDDQLWPIIRVPIPKTISVVFQMLPLERALKSQEMRATMAEEDVNQSSYRTSARMRVRAGEAGDLEYQIASNSGEVGRPALNVVTYGDDPGHLDKLDSQLNQAWLKSQIRLRSFTDDHARGFEPHLPLGRGLPDISK